MMAHVKLPKMSPRDGAFNLISNQIAASAAVAESRRKAPSIHNYSTSEGERGGVEQR